MTARLTGEQYNRMLDDYAAERLERACDEVVEFARHMFDREVDEAEFDMIVDTLDDALTRIIDHMAGNGDA